MNIREFEQYCDRLLLDDSEYHPLAPNKHLYPNQKQWLFFSEQDAKAYQYAESLRAYHEQIRMASESMIMGQAQFGSES